ncbi:hypothetical protein MPC1_2140003 [Methylocella tundrae]|nr:hypothetical protein MPC1_2140003 [Methylocella tundrae]
MKSECGEEGVIKGLFQDGDFIASVFVEDFEGGEGSAVKIKRLQELHADCPSGRACVREGFFDLSDSGGRRCHSDLIFRVGRGHARCRDSGLQSRGSPARFNQRLRD